MSSISDEIEKLQLRMFELEKQRQRQLEKETLDKTSISHNFAIITDLLDEKKTAITNNRYSKMFRWRDIMTKNW